MMFQAQSVGVIVPSTRISLRCPACRQQGILDEFKTINDLTINLPPAPILLGQRRCPNPNCNGHIFFAYQGSKVLISYPTEKIDFDSTKIPPAIVHSLEEAITCYSNQCFIAGAIMVRKTLEELCSDRNAKGKNLRDRIQSLKTKLILPEELLEGLDSLRLLGNDAAHIESKEFGKIGNDEVGIAIELTKEILKAVYQYSSLLERLHSLRKQK